MAIELARIVLMQRAESNRDERPTAMTNTIATRFALRSLVTRVGLIAVCSLPLAACDAEQPNAADDLGTMRMVELPEGGTCVTLFAGQHIDAGTVCVTVDAGVDTSAQCGEGATGALQVVYATHDGWELVETHLAYGNEMADIPTNKKGNPKIGLFPLASGDITGATTQGFEIPLCELGLDGADEVCEPTIAYLAAHASVRKDNGDGSFQTETGWGEGDGLNDQGSWAQMFSVELECHACKGEEPPPVAECETAFAFADDGSGTCFIGADFDGDGIDDGFNRWGWSNGPIAPGTSTQWPVYAGAGQCNLDNGALVGHLSVSYDGATAEVTFDGVGGYVLDEEHLYIGSEPLARNVNDELTVAPGQYPVVVDLDGATQTFNSVTGLSGDVYVVYHAVACGGGEAGEGGGEDKGPDPLASFDDDFDGDLSGWEIYDPAAAAVSIVDGAMSIEPGASTQWYATDEAVHVNKAISGDFMVTTRMSVTNLAGESTAVGGPYRIGGLMLRDGNGGPNTVHMGIGTMNDPSVSVVTKSTDDGVSDVHTAMWAGGTEAELRLCRVGVDVQALVRMPGQAWTLINEFQRADLPQTLAAGPIAYAGTADADLRAEVEWVRFHSASSLADCMME